jgi:uridine kinase
MNPFVLGIAGGSCSGKSTFAKLVADELRSAGHPVVVIGLDAFYTRDLERGPTVTLSDGTTMFDFNQPSAIDVGAAVAAIEAAEAEFAVVEGLFTLAIDQIRSRLDYAVFVHLDADLRAIRRLLRDMKGGRASTDPEFIACYYIESARVGHAKYVEPSRALANIEVIGDDGAMAAAIPNLLEDVRLAGRPLNDVT